MSKRPYRAKLAQNPKKNEALGSCLNAREVVYIYYLPGVQICGWVSFRFWANLALYGRLLENEAPGQVGGYGFGQVLTKHIFFIEDTPSTIGYGVL